jgi:hypothetical protein
MADAVSAENQITDRKHRMSSPPSPSLAFVPTQS